MPSGVYQIRNKINGKAYIGSASDFAKRFFYHRDNLKKNKHPNGKLQNSWNKHGEDAFEFVRIVHCDKQDLIAYEQFCLDLYGAAVTGYNIRHIAHNNIGMQVSLETRKKLSSSLKGKKKSPRSKEHCLSISRRQTGKKLSEAGKQKLRAFWTGKKRNPMSDAQKQLLREINTGKKYSDEVRQKISKANSGRKLTDEHKRKLSESNKVTKKRISDSRKLLQEGMA